VLTPEPTAEVTAAVLIVDGRVLAARRTHPDDVAGRWELRGGKIDPGESPAEAVIREISEELGCEVDFVCSLEGRSPIKPGYELTAHLVRLTGGEPIPHEHDAIRWLAAEELDELDWLPSDRPFLPQIAELLAAAGRQGHPSSDG
jgi:8-oxo-dGTP diphosphatase